MNNAEAKFYMEEIRKLPITYSKEEQESMDLAIDMFGAEDCIDCISRAEAISKQIIIYDDDGVGHIVVRVSDLKDLKPVKSPRVPRKWILNHEPYTWMGYATWICPECGYEQSEGPHINYCKMCGSYNVGDERCDVDK